MIELHRLNAICIDHSQHFFSFDAIATLLPYFTLSNGGGWIAQICPAAGHRPLAIRAFLYQEDFSITYNGAAHINLWCGISCLHREAFKHGFLFHLGLAGDYFSSDFLQTLVSLNIELILAVSQPCLAERENFLGPFHPF